MQLLTTIGMEMASRGFFRPNLLAMKPNSTFPINPPTHKSDAIQDASSISILPDGNGVSSDVSKLIVGLAQPTPIPSQTVSKFTVLKQQQKNVSV